MEGSDIFLKCLWKNPESFLCSPSASSECRVFVQVYPFHSRSVLFEYHQTLNLLKKLWDIFSSRDFEKPIQPSRHTDFQSLAHKFILEMQEGSVVHIPVNSTSSSSSLRGAPGGVVESEELFQSFPFQNRFDYDFCELLWETISKASNVSEMSEFLRLVFEKIQKGKILPIIHKQNKTTLGELFRDSVKRHQLFSTGNLIENDDRLSRAYQHWQEKENILESIIELGISKLIGDYTHFMLSE
eukprot:Sdes_comp9791_c0_seq1m1327